MSKRRSDEEVTLNVTAMLDMAFQLLAFFVLTFKPPPGEDQIYLKLPPAQPVATWAERRRPAQDETKDIKDVKPTKSLIVTLDDRNGGSITDVIVGIPGTNLMKTIAFNDLEKELRGYFRAKDESDTGGQKGCSGRLRAGCDQCLAHVPLGRGHEGG